MQFVQENVCFLGIRGVFFECGRNTKADDVVDWIFGLMRAVRDTGPTIKPLQQTSMVMLEQTQRST